MLQIEVRAQIYCRGQRPRAAVATYLRIRLHAGRKDRQRTLLEGINLLLFQFVHRLGRRERHDVGRETGPGSGKWREGRWAVGRVDGRFRWINIEPIIPIFTVIEGCLHRFADFDPGLAPQLAQPVTTHDTLAICPFFIISHPCDFNSLKITRSDRTPLQFSPGSRARAPSLDKFGLCLPEGNLIDSRSTTHN